MKKIDLSNDVSARFSEASLRAQSSAQPKASKPAEPVKTLEPNAVKSAGPIQPTKPAREAAGAAPAPQPGVKAESMRSTEAWSAQAAELLKRDPTKVATTLAPVKADESGASQRLKAYMGAQASLGEPAVEKSAKGGGFSAQA